MKNRFTIGETAEIMGISVQTLRYYSNSGLVTPEYVDRRTGYRYYTFNQLHFIDRIKYLRSLGVPLKGIKEALKDGRGEALLPHLKKQYDELCSSVEELIQARDGLKWYID